MSPTEIQIVDRFASDASEINVLCHYLSIALAAEPSTAIAAQAIDGIKQLAKRLENNLTMFADPDA